MVFYLVRRQGIAVARLGPDGIEPTAEATAARRARELPRCLREALDGTRDPAGWGICGASYGSGSGFVCVGVEVTPDRVHDLGEHLHLRDGQHVGEVRPDGL